VRIASSIALLLAVTLAASAPSVAAIRDWTLPNTAGGDYTLSEHTGSGPILLLFWATWCVPCKRELKELHDTYSSFAEQGVEVLLISIDTQKTMSRVRPYVQSKKLPWTSLLDSDHKVFKKYGGKSFVPYTVLLDTSGSPVFTHPKEMKDPGELIRKVESLLPPEESDETDEMGSASE